MNPMNILKLIQQYQRTGRIADSLIPYFDQDGKWRGDRKRFPKSTFTIARRIMAKAVLPLQRRSHCVNGRRILRTSFVWTRECTTVIADWHEIQGSLILGCMAGFDGTNLELIGGHLLTDLSARLDCPKLETIRGEHDSLRSREIEIPNLRHVGGSMRTTNRNFSKLETVGGDLMIQHSADVDFPQLLSVGGDLNATDCTIFAAAKLERVGTSPKFEATDQSTRAPLPATPTGAMNLMSAKSIKAPALVLVTGDLDTRSATAFAPRKLRVGGSWTMPENARALMRANKKAVEALRENPDLYL
jgi:hypothetical protein